MGELHRKNIYALIIYIIAVGTLFGSCVPGSIETESVPTPSLQEKTDTPEQTVTPTATQTVIEITATPTRTPTRIPVLKGEEALAYIESYYKDNGGCELPCWWGLTPGVSTEDDVFSLLSRLDRPNIEEHNNLNQYSYSFEAPFNEDFPYYDYSYIYIWMLDGKVIFISVNSLDVSESFDFSLSGILKTFGTPSEIWIKPIVYDWESPYYRFDVLFSEQGINLVFGGDFFVDNKELRICLDSGSKDYPYLPPWLLLFSKENINSFNDITELIGPFEPNEYYLLDDIAFGYSVSDFYDQFIVPGANQCIELDEEVFVTLED